MVLFLLLPKLIYRPGVIPKFVFTFVLLYVDTGQEGLQCDASREIRGKALRGTLPDEQHRMLLPEQPLRRRLRVGDRGDPSGAQCYSASAANNRREHRPQIRNENRSPITLHTLKHKLNHSQHTKTPLELP